MGVAETKPTTTFMITQLVSKTSKIQSPIVPENIYFEMQQERQTSAASLEEKEGCFLSSSVERKC